MKRGKMKLGGPTSKGKGLSQLFKFAAYGTLGLGAAGDSLAETVITFGGFSGNNIDINTIPGFGDNISANSADWEIRAGRIGIVGTPGITLDWLGAALPAPNRSGWDTYTAWDGRGNVAQTDFNVGPALSLLFAPSADSAVRLISFELDEWAGGGAGSIAWSLSGTVSGLMASGNWTMSEPGGRDGIFPDKSGLVGENLILSFSLNSGLPSYFALDNLAFDQVPEPSTCALGALGAVALGAAAMRRRRRA